MKRQYISAILATALFLLGACSTSEESTTKKITEVASSTVVSYDQDDLDEDYSDEDAQEVTLCKNSISYDGEGASVNNTTITITKAGTYIFHGTINDGNIIVDASKDDLIRIVLDNAHITSSSTAPIYVQQADKVLLTLAKDSNNTLKDAESYQLANTSDNEPNAAIFSKDDITINGSGKLIITAQYNNGIQSKDDLKIVNGTIHVDAKDNGIVGKDILAIRDGSIMVVANGDGLRSTNTQDNDSGIVCIENGTLNITAQQDGIQSENKVYIYGGTINITAGGGNTNGTKIRNEIGFNPFEQQDTASSTTVSMKGIKAVNELNIYKGKIQIDSADDALHSNANITIQGGTIHLSSGDDGIHADAALTIAKGTLDIAVSYEGLEGETITIKNGTIHIQASDDGVNASGTTPRLDIQGGYLYVRADGDGLDSNGDITMSDGTVIINGTQNNGDGALDFDGEFTIQGGTLISSGPSGMLQYPTTVSNGNLAVISFISSISDMVHLQDSNGNSILTYQSDRTYQSLAIYSDKLVDNDTVEIYTGGSASSVKDGVYRGDDYQGGTFYDTFTISQATTLIGSIQNMGPRGDRQGGFGF